MLKNSALFSWTFKHYQDYIQPGVKQIKQQAQALNDAVKSKNIDLIKKYTDELGKLRGAFYVKKREKFLRSKMGGPKANQMICDYGLWIRGNTDMQQLLVPACLVTVDLEDQVRITIGHAKSKDLHWPARDKKEEKHGFIYEYRSWVDLNENLSPIKDEKILKEIKKGIAFAKLIYASTIFNSEEKMLIQEWWQTVSRNDKISILESLKTY